MEPAGLAVGAVSALALFDSAMNTFERIEDGTSYGRDWQRSTLKIELLRLRLMNWGEAVDIAKDPELAGIADAGKQDKVRELLGSIQEDLESAEKVSRKKSGDASPNFERDESLATITSKVRNLAISRQKNKSIITKTKWVLRDKRRLENLVGDLSESVRDLVEIFPVQNQQLTLAKKDAERLVQPAKVEEPGNGQDPAALQDAAKEVYPELLKALDRIAQQQMSRHTFGDAVADGNAKIHEGGYTATGFHGQVTGSSNTYGNLNAKGDARVQRGDIHGGKSVWDD